MIRALVFDFDGLILETETPSYQTWAEIYREHGHELPMDRWHGYVGSDTGFDPAGHLGALVGEGFDRNATQARRDARKTELIAALDVMVGVREYVADAKRLGLRLAALEALGAAPHEAVAFEDSMNGIAAAKAAGLLCVAVPNTLTAGMDLSRADMRLSSLAETSLERLLAVLSAL